MAKRRSTYIPTYAAWQQAEERKHTLITGLVFFTYAIVAGIGSFIGMAASDVVALMH